MPPAGLCLGEGARWGHISRATSRHAYAMVSHSPPTPGDANLVVGYASLSQSPALHDGWLILENGLNSSRQVYDAFFLQLQHLAVFNETDTHLVL